MSGVSLVIFNTKDPNKFRLAARDARNASCGESRPEWIEVTTLDRKQARVMVKHGIAEDRARVVPVIAKRKPGEPVVHALRANVKLDLEKLRKKKSAPGT
mgnify:CR=1 FL=1